MSWDEQLVEDFLSEYRKHECLWNPFHRQFHDCLAKGEALKKVVKNLRLGFGVQDCLKLLKCIREKYVEDQTKSLLKLRSSLCQPKWMQILESMLEKIVCDEDCKSNYLTPLRKKPEPPVKILFRHTIQSKKRKCPTNPKQKRRRRKKCKRPRGKLERRGHCCNNNNAERVDMDPCRAAQDCSRPQTNNWCKQRDDYLDKITWQKPCAKTIECPGLASHIERCNRIENVGKDPCATTPVYMCPNRATHVNCNQSYGRRRQTDIYPTEPRTACPPRKPSPPRSPCKKEKKSITPCPPSPPIDDKCAIDKKDPCTKDTCPSYSHLKCKDETKSSEQSTPTCTTIAPRVAAKFENGVLEACSQFKVIIPSSSLQESSSLSSSSKKKCCTQKVQTDSTTRECAVGVESRDFLRTKRNKSPKKKDMSVCTCDDFVECAPEKEASDQKLDNPCHDYVLLTPGGKYVPLVRTKSETNEKEDECTCCSVESKKPRQEACCEMTRQDNDQERNCEKQNVDKCDKDDDKCPSPTTKLLLRCLEHMLNLEEQQSMSKSTDACENNCEPCRRKQLAEAASSTCLQCLEERLGNSSNNNNNASSSSPRGKLTQNFLEILKCAMELDCNNRKDEEDNTNNNNNCCRCNGGADESIVLASSTPKSINVDQCKTILKNNNNNKNEKLIQRKVSMKETAFGDSNGRCNAESKATQDKVACTSKGIQCDSKKNRDKQGKRDTVLDNLMRCANWQEYKNDKRDDDDVEPTITKVPATTIPETQQTHHRDTTLSCLREELQRDKRIFDQGKIVYDEVYRSYIMRSPTCTSPTRYNNGCYR